MECQNCGTQAQRFGRDRHGHQRYQCRPCRRTFTGPHAGPLGPMRLPMDKAVLCLRQLLEGCSVRSTMRLTGVDKRTILRLLVTVGRRCKSFLEEAIRRIPVADVEADELWGYIGCKEKTRLRKNYAECFGDAYCFVALERTTKLVLAWHLGKRSAPDTADFMDNLRRAVTGRFQITTDGFTPYRTAVPFAFGPQVDFAQLIKEYAIPEEEERRYTPPEVVSTTKVVCRGIPDEDRICTSHVERANLTMRMTIRRLTRLTNGFSKKWENHEAALALYFAFYNFCRVHMTLKCTPAVAAGLTDHTWSVRELVETAGAAA